MAGSEEGISKRNRELLTKSYTSLAITLIIEDKCTTAEAIEAVKEIKKAFE